MIPDDPRTYQMIPDEIISDDPRPKCSQRIPDDHRWSQMIPDDSRLCQMIPDDPRMIADDFRLNDFR